MDDEIVDALENCPGYMAEVCGFVKPIIRTTDEVFPINMRSTTLWVWHLSLLTIFLTYFRVKCNSTIRF